LVGALGSGGGGGGGGGGDGVGVAEEDSVVLDWVDSVILGGGFGATENFADAEDISMDEDGGLELPIVEPLEEDLKDVWNEEGVCAFDVEDAWAEEGEIDEVETLLLGRAQVPPS
jgi:hypothetical protein